MTVPNLIPLHALLAHGRSIDHPVGHDGQRLVLWGEFASRVSALANRLAAREESRWLLASDDSLYFAIKLFAMLYAGKQVVIPPNTQPGTLAALGSAFDAWLGDDEIPDASPHVGGAVLADIDPQQAIIDLYTSGSTGEAKQVRKTLAQFETEVEVLESSWGAVLGSSAVVSTVPHHHIYGLLFRLFWPVAAGRVFDSRMCEHPEMLRERLSVLGTAALVSSPAHLARMPELVPLISLAPRPIIIFSSGGPVSAATAKEFFQKLGQAPTEVFGSTETGGVAWRRQEAGEDSDLWTPFPCMDVRRSASGGLSLASPYLGRDARWEMDDGIELLPDGRFRLLGRLDRIVKIEEKRLSLPDMESRLNAHAWVSACALAPLSGRRQRIGAVVVLNAEGRQQIEETGRRVLTQALRKHLASHYEAVLLPRHWRFVGQLPINERGKVVHSAVAGLFTAEEDVVLYPEVVHVNRGEDENDSLVLDLHVPPALVHFAGHFPELPILPGVVQVDWAIRYAREHLALSGRFSSLETLKFLALVLPDTRLQLSLKWNAQIQRLDFAYSNSQRNFSSGRIFFCGAE